MARIRIGKQTELSTVGGAIVLTDILTNEQKYLTQGTTGQVLTESTVTGPAWATPTVSLLKCDSTAFVIATDLIPQYSTTLTTSFGAGNATGQCLVQQDYEFNATNNSFAFNRTQGIATAAGSFSMANSNNEVDGTKSISLGGGSNVLTSTATFSGTYACDSITLSGTGTQLGAIYSSGGSIIGTADLRTLIATQGVAIQGTGSRNHVYASSFLTMNNNGGLNTIIGCFTATIAVGVKESGAFNSQSPNFVATGARTGFFTTDVSTTVQSARNASCMNGEGLTAWTVDQTVIGSYNYGTPTPTLSNSPVNDNWNLVIGNGVSAGAHNAFSVSSQGIIRLQTNNNTRDPSTNTLNNVSFAAVTDQDQSATTAGVKMFRMAAGLDSGGANAFLMKFDNDPVVYKVVLVPA